MDRVAIMKRLVAAAAALAALCFTSPARAYVSEANIGYTKAIIQKLRDTGVTIVRPTTCPRSLVGKYEPSTAVLMLCPSAMADEELFVQTVAHESIHAVQHCVGGPLANVNGHSAEDNAKTLVEAIGRDKLPHVLRVIQGLGPVAAINEYEAYALEDFPDIALGLLNRFCR